MIGPQTINPPKKTAATMSRVWPPDLPPLLRLFEPLFLDFAPPVPPDWDFSFSPQYWQLALGIRRRNLFSATWTKHCVLPVLVLSGLDQNQQSIDAGSRVSWISSGSRVFVTDSGSEPRGP